MPHPPERVCGKKPYASRRDAERECQGVRRRCRDDGLHVYYCERCRAFHFGHRPRRPRR